MSAVNCLSHVDAAAQQNKDGGSGVGIDASDPSLIESVVAEYNNTLVFDASADKMAYTIRDPLMTGLSV